MLSTSGICLSGILLLCSLLPSQAWYYGRPEPELLTNGSVWPQPVDIRYTTPDLVVNPSTINFVSSLSGCDIIDKALKRYKSISFPGFDASTYSDSAAQLLSVYVQITTKPGNCTTTYPHLDMDESYRVTVPQAGGQAVIQANEVWGALRGLETLSQLVYFPAKNIYRIRTATVTDHPRFPHRGFMIDTARHFIAVEQILNHVEIMAENKFNVLHWHLTDSESFPYTSLVYPEMTKGAYSPAHVYSVADMRRVVEFARIRGVRVIPEFDTPGHTGAWKAGKPHLMPACTGPSGQSLLPNILDPTLNETYDFLRGFFKEALTLFPDDYIHIGGDEVSSDMLECWQRNSGVMARGKQLGLTTTDAMLNYYFNQLFAILNSIRPGGVNKMVWQEVLDQNVKAAGTIAHVWKGDTYAEALQEMAAVTSAGHRAVLSSCWYLNYIKYGADWGYIQGTSHTSTGLYYECDPQGFSGTAAQKDLVMGGEAALWSEFVDGTNLISRSWPRASAVAERLWSPATKGAPTTADADAAWPRLHEFRCRLIRRGFQAQPIMDPDFCPFEWPVKVVDGLE